MPDTEGEAGRKKGDTGKLVTGLCGGPAHDPVGYLETMIEYYLPGLQHRHLNDREFAQKVAHLLHLTGKSRQ